MIIINIGSKLIFHTGPLTNNVSDLYYYFTEFEEKCFIYNNLSEEPANAPSCKKQLFSLCQSRLKTQPCRDCRSILSFPHLESAKKIKNVSPRALTSPAPDLYAVVFNQPAHLHHSLMHPTIDWPRPLSLCCLH